MATQPNTEKQFEAAAERVRELNERIIASTRKAGNATLDSYERALLSVADFQANVGETSPVELVATITQAQANLIRDLTKSYTAAARALVN